MSASPLLDDFVRRVREVIARDLERERARAEDLRAEVLPALAASLADLRAEGRVGDAWLFGSYAWGQPLERSDVDLLVETFDAPFALAAEIGHRVRRMVHLVPLSAAPPSLVERVARDGVRL